MSSTSLIAPRHAAALLMALSVAVISACGGGGDAPAQVASAGERATAYAAGPISGFGSVIVNGIRYDDSSAQVTDDDDRAHSRDLLKLGMVVEVDGASLDAASGTGRALRIRFGSEIVGPVSAVDTAAATLVVLGQTVEVKDTTVFDDSLAGGLAGVAIGSVLEVHAQYNAATGNYAASRIESEAGATAYKLRGVVADLDTTANTFTLGGQVVNYRDIAPADLPLNLANGLRVRVRLQTSQVNGQWMATSVRSGVRKVEDRDEAHLRGTITVLASTTDFEVNGLKVDASAASFPDGRDGVVLGAQVEVEGKVVAGVLVATKVELDDHHAGERHRIELHGLVSALDTGAKSFMLRGVKVSYAGSVTFKRGSEADLADGKRVEVKGTPSADRTMLDAKLIQFEN